MIVQGDRPLVKRIDSQNAATAPGAIVGYVAAVIIILVGVYAVPVCRGILSQVALNADSLSLDSEMGNDSITGQID